MALAGSRDTRACARRGRRRRDRTVGAPSDCREKVPVIQSVNAARRRTSDGVTYDTGDTLTLDCTLHAMRLIFGPEHNITLGLEATLTAYRVFGKRLRAEYVPLSPDCLSAEPCMDVLVRTGVGAAWS
eukprot:scaffold89064_cov66-Phaeocystis_antarctica.AAC.5